MHGNERAHILEELCQGETHRYTGPVVPMRVSTRAGMLVLVMPVLVVPIVTLGPVPVPMIVVPVTTVVLIMLVLLIMLVVAFARHYSPFLVLSRGSTSVVSSRTAIIPIPDMLSLIHI